jgi:hypothetical protein
MSLTSLRWGRIALGGFLAELILFMPVILVYAVGGGQTAVTVVAVAGSFFVFVPVAWWLARSLPRAVLHGALMGAAAAALYMGTGAVASAFIANAPPVPLIYYVAHVLKIAGGATG